MSRGDIPHHLNAKQRDAVILETFEAITAVGFMKWKAEELALGYEVSEKDRQLYMREFEKRHFPNFQKLAANSSIDRLFDAREFWIGKADAMGIKEWQHILSKGEGAKSWYDAIGQEIENQNSNRTTTERSPQQGQAKDHGRDR